MAGVAVGEAFVKIRPDTTGFETDAKRSMGAVLGGIATGFAAIKVKEFFTDAFAEATQAQKVGAQTAAVLKSTGEAAGVSAKQIGELASKLSDVAAVDDEVVQSGANLLLTFKQVQNQVGAGNKIFDRTLKVALDLSTAMGTDLNGAIVQVGKALNDPTSGLTALTRVGVTFTDQQKEQIKTLQQSGDLLAAQKIILKELTSEFGGSAAAQATDAQRLSVAYGNLKEAIGTALLPVISGLSKALTPIAKFFAENKTAAAALAITIGVALVTALGAWTVGALASTAANLKLAASYVLVGRSAAQAGTGMGAAAAAGGAGGLVGVLSSLGAMAGVAAGGIGAVAAGLGVAAVGVVAFVGSFKLTTMALEAIFGKSKDYTKALDEETAAAKNAAKAHGGDLVKAFEKVKEASRNAMDVQGSSIVVFIRAFKEVAKQSIPAAQELMEKFKSQPRLYKAAEQALAGVVAKNKEADAAARAHAAGITTTQQAMEDLNTYIRAQIDNGLRLEGAQIAMERAVATFGQTLRETTLDTLEGRQAFLDTKRSVEDYGQAVFDSAKLAGKSTSASTQEQINSLSYVAGTLEPGSPLRTWLEQYIDLLRNGIPKQIETEIKIAITAVGTAATGVVQDVQTSVQSWLAPKAAEGGFFRARPGGIMANIAEGREDEFVLPVSKLQSMLDVAATSGSGGGGDTFHIYTQSTDPVPFALEVSRKKRRAMFLAGR